MVKRSQKLLVGGVVEEDSQAGFAANRNPQENRAENRFAVGIFYAQKSRLGCKSLQNVCPSLKRFCPSLKRFCSGLKRSCSGLGVRVYRVYCLGYARVKGLRSRVYCSVWVTRDSTSERIGLEFTV